MPAKTVHVPYTATCPLKLGEDGLTTRNGEIRIDAEFIAVDAWVGRAAEHLVVARIRKRQTIGDMSNAILTLIAEDLPPFCDDIPKEQKKCAAPFQGIVPPIVAAQAVHVIPYVAVFVVQQRGVVTKRLRTA